MLERLKEQARYTDVGPEEPAHVTYAELRALIAEVERLRQQEALIKGYAPARDVVERLVSKDLAMYEHMQKSNDPCAAQGFMAYLIEDTRKVCTELTALRSAYATLREAVAPLCPDEWLEPEAGTMTCFPSEYFKALRTVFAALTPRASGPTDQ